MRAQLQFRETALAQAGLRFGATLRETALVHAFAPVLRAQVRFRETELAHAGRREAP